MDLYDSWNEIDIQNILKIDKEYWDIKILINIMTYNLNNSNMENPYPTFPNNPFNRKLIDKDSLIKIKNKIKKNKIPIHISLKTFLLQPLNSIQQFHDDAIKSKDGYSPKIIEVFQQKLRFMMINSKNSQDLYTGMWVDKNYPVTKFESLYKTAREIPYQIFFNNQIIDNPTRQKLQFLLSYYSADNYELNDKKFLEFL